MDEYRERDESFVTADESHDEFVLSATVPKSLIDYDLSPAVICLDCQMDVAVTTKEVSLVRFSNGFGVNSNKCYSSCSANARSLLLKLLGKARTCG
jgi:hypothetical protein